MTAPITWTESADGLVRETVIDGVRVLLHGHGTQWWLVLPGRARVVLRSRPTDDQVRDLVRASLAERRAG